MSIDSWKNRYAYNPELQIELHLKKDIKEQDELQLFTIENLIDNIDEKRCIIIKGNPGAGKTISLLQIADYLLDKNSHLIPIFISLSEWSNRQVDLMIFLSEELSPFDKTVTEEEISFLYSEGKIVLLLNGWNEVSQSTIFNFTQEFKRIVRNSPPTPFVISSRETELPLPFVESTVFYLVPLNRNQRNEIIRNHKIVNEDLIINQIDSNPNLYEIAQAPLYLTALIKIFSKHGVLPRSRYQILKELLKPSTSEHEVALRNESTYGFHNPYLQNIAYSFVKGGVTGSTQSEIISNIADSNAYLYDSCKRGQIPNANDVLNTLTDHHLLMRPIDDKGLFRFNHQQFQELYAAEKLYEDLKNILNSKSSKDIARFKIEIINNQQWEESIIFLVEKLSFDCNDNKDFDILTDLIRWIIPIDLFFTSELVGIIREKIWVKIGKEISHLLRDFYNNGSSRIKEYALSCIFATGSPDFSDIVIPLIENDDDQIRWSTYRIYEPFPVTCLGDDWGSRFIQWDEKHQVEFVHEIGVYSYSGQASIIDQIIDMDTTNEVKIAVCEVLAANQIDDKLISILEESNWSIIFDSQLLHWCSKRFILEYSDKIREAIINDSNLYRKIDNLLILAKAKDFNAVSLLQQEISNNPHIQHSYVFNCLQVIGKIDPEWVNQWLSQKLLMGNYWNFVYDKMRDFREQLQDIFVGENSGMLSDLFNTGLSPSLTNQDLRKRLAVLSIINSEYAAKVYLNELLKVSAKIEDERLSVILNEVNSLPIASKVKALVEHNFEPKYESVITVIDFLKAENYGVDIDEKSLSEELSKSLRNRICEWINLNLSSSDDHGRLRAEFALILGKCGNIEDLEIIKEWLLEDKERYEKEYKAWLDYRDEIKRTRNRPKNIVHYRGVWSQHYTKAISLFKSQEAIDLLKKLLYDYDYIGIVSRALIKHYYPDLDTNSLIFNPLYMNDDKSNMHSKQVKKISSSNDKISIDSDIKEAIIALRKFEGIEDKSFLYYENISKTAYWLSHICDKSAVSIILSSMEHGGSLYDLTNSIEILFQRGFSVPAIGIINAIENLILKIEEECERDRNSDKSSMIHKYIHLLLFSDQPELGVQKLKKLSGRCLYTYNIRDTIIALGNCGNKEAEQYLIELNGQQNILRYCYDEWLQALSNYSNPIIRQIFKEHIKRIEQEESEKSYLDFHSSLERALINLLGKDVDYWDEMKTLCISAVSQKTRSLLSSVLEKTETEQSAYLACYLMRDNLDPNIPNYDYRIIEKMFKVQIPSEYPNSYYEESKSCNKLRDFILDMAKNDLERRKCALELLVSIENIRVNKGRPSDEPRHPKLSENVELGKPWMMVN